MTDAGHTPDETGRRPGEQEAAPYRPPLPRQGKTGFPVGPMFYPKMLRKVANLIEALTAFDEPDPEGNESPAFVGRATLPIWNEEATEDGDETAGLYGWVTQIDTACWVFVPFASEIEADPAAVREAS